MESVLVVLGTRPEAIKLAPVVRAIRSRGGATRLTLCSTGQHRELLDTTLAAFDLRPDLDLGLMQPDQSLAGTLGRLLLRMQGVLDEVRPDGVVVQGDTLSAMGAAQAAFLWGARVAHVEAGLRTRTPRTPFPEEVDRRVIGVLADHHFAPTERARRALLAEGTPEDRVLVTGNTGIDALLWMRERVEDRPLPPGLADDGAPLVLVTAHRRESFGAGIESICRALHELAGAFPERRFVYPVHPNPKVRGPVHALLGRSRGIELVEPLAYPDLVALLARAELVLTDSGGLQEEAPSLGKPVLVLRERTERPEAIEAGAAELVGTSTARIVEAAGALLSDPVRRARMGQPRALYGDGRAAERIADVLVEGRCELGAFLPHVERAAG